MLRKRDRAVNRLLIALALALVVHFLGLGPTFQWLIWDQEKAPAEKPKPKERWIEVPLSPQPTPAQVKIDVQPPPRAAVVENQQPVKEQPKEKPPEKPERLDGQFVEIPPPDHQEAPEDSKLISAYNSKVEKEQVNRNRDTPTPRVHKSDRFVISTGDEESDAEADAHPMQQSKRPPSDRPGNDDQTGPGEHPVDRPGDPRRNPQEMARATEPPKPMLPRAGDFEARRQAAAAEARRELGPGQTAGGSSGGPPAVSNLLANMGPEEMARQDGFDSHVDDVDDGDTTALNARQTRYADFFTRVVHSVRQHWHAVDAHRQHDPYGHIYGVRDRVTVVDVTLNADGSLDDIKVAQDSGVAYLDEAALKAFRDAQPFPNPPPGLRDPDGRIRFRFQFWLEIDGAGGFRLFRNTD